MKKSAFLLALPVVILLSGCGSDKIDVTDTNIEVDVCNEYFELMDCILENDNDANYTEEMRDELRLKIKDIQAEWEGLDEEELSNKCSTELAKFNAIQDRLEAIGCINK